MKVYITQPIPKIANQIIQKSGHSIEQNTQDRVLAADELKRAVVGYDAILSLLTDKISDQILDAAGDQLKIVANYAVGYDNIDLAAAQKRAVVVTNTPGVLTEAVAEHTFALLISVARRIVEADLFMRQGKYSHWLPMGFIGPQLSGKTLGVVGLGRIGHMVARIANKGFGMKVIYNDLKPDTEFEQEFDAKWLAVDALLAQADVVSLHVPLLESTRHLINADRLKLMKSSAILINTARGPVIDEGALVQALKTKQIWAAGLDVFEDEPKLKPGLADLPNVVVTPHIASATTQAREGMAKIAAQNIVAVLAGQAALNPVTAKS